MPSRKPSRDDDDLIVYITEEGRAVVDGIVLYLSERVGRPINPDQLGAAMKAMRLRGHPALDLTVPEQMDQFVEALRRELDKGCDDGRGEPTEQARKH